MSNLSGIKPCCLSGHLHTGEELGKVIDFAGLKTYVTGENKAQTLVFITDVFGYELKNIRLLADEYSQSGFQVLIPDIFKGDVVPSHHMKILTPLSSDIPPENVDELKGQAFGAIGPWVERQSDSVVGPLIRAVFEELVKDKDVEKIGVVGFCWGGRQALLLAGDAESKIDVALANHPSFTEFPEVFKAVKKPTLIQIGDNDSFFPPEQVKEIKETIFPSFANAEILVYPGAPHGFTNRSDQNNKEEVKLKEDAAVAGINFLRKYMG